MKISIIIVAYHSGTCLSKLLGQLEAQSDKNFSVILINNSQDDTKDIQELASRYEFIKFIQNKANTGYAGGNNVGLKKAFAEAADWCLCLNPDTEINNKDFVADLKGGLHDKRGLVGLPIQEPKDKVYGGQIQWLRPELKQNVSQPKDNFYIHGGALAIHCATFEKLGPLDENYFLYFEDADYSLKAQRTGIKISYLDKPEITHLLSASTKSLGSPTVLRYHYRNALYFNRENGSEFIQILTAIWSLWLILKQSIKIILNKNTGASTAILKGVFDFYLNRMGKLPDPKIKRIGIECESIEGKNPMWGIGRIIIKLLEEIASRPELEKEYKFVLYFKDTVPDMPFLSAPIFEKKITPVPGAPGRLFPFYYYALLPIKLWFEDLSLMFWPNYMLPIIAFGKSLVLLTEDVYYESHDGKLPFRYRLAYGIFGEWSAKFATRILAISETSKNQLTKLYGIDERRITVNQLGIDLQKHEIRSTKSEKDFILYVGQAFPRRHLRETILAFENIAPDFKDLKLVAVGPDKYEIPVIKSLTKEVNERLGREAVTHKDYVTDDELESLYRGARALVYVSDREAFGLPPMEASSYGVPPVVMDNQLGHELFGEHAFYAKSGSLEDISQALRQALTDKEKQEKIRVNGKNFSKQYTWKMFANRWLDAINKLVTSN